MKNNNKSYFEKFTKARGPLEQFLRENKPLIGQAIVNIGSSSRVPRLVEMYDVLIDRFSKNQTVSVEELWDVLKLQGKVFAGDLQAATQFSAETKSEIFLNASLESAITCPICHGLVDTSKSVSYDHIERIQDGGKGGTNNGQLTHPYCNSAIKN